MFNSKGKEIKIVNFNGNEEIPKMSFPISVCMEDIIRVSQLKALPSSWLIIVRNTAPVLHIQGVKKNEKWFSFMNLLHLEL